MTIIIAASLGVQANAAQLVIPVHGTVLDVGPNGTAIIRNDPVTGIVPSVTRIYRVEPHLALASGVGLDGFLDRSSKPWRWYDAAIAGPFVAGLPDTGRVIPLDLGAVLPKTRLVDQNGSLVDLSRDFLGKTLLISFVFTRCPDRDECPAISSKFAYLQSKIDPRRFHLIEMTLDPAYDSPAVLREYAHRFGANAATWSLLTGQQHDIQHLLNRFGISSLKVSDARFIHNDKVFISGPDGKIGAIVQTIAFAPNSLLAQARHIAGLSSSPLGRIELTLIAGAAALCGGSQFAGIVLLETVLFLIIAVLSFLALSFVARVLWSKT